MHPDVGDGTRAPPAVRTLEGTLKGLSPPTRLLAPSLKRGHQARPARATRPKRSAMVTRAKRSAKLGSQLRLPEISQRAPILKTGR